MVISFREKWIPPTFLVIIWALVCASNETIWARSFRVDMLPNGNVLGCASCHVKSSGGGPRTSFGNEVWSIVGRSRAPFWSEALAAMDSDGDGFSNGQELGDPDGDGIVEAGSQVTNPGDAGSFPEVTTHEPATTPLLIQLDGNDVTLTWEGGGTLETSESPLGPWLPVTNASSPYQTSIHSPMMFYRVGGSSGG